MTVLFFGASWDAAILDGAEQIPTPIGTPCKYCEEPIAEGDQGMVSQGSKLAKDWDLISFTLCEHRECGLRAVLGGIAHVERRCTCCGGMAEPDDGLGWRESARRVLALVEHHGVGKVVAGYLRAPR